MSTDDPVRTQPEPTTDAPTAARRNSATMTSWIRDVVDAATEHPGEWVEAYIQAPISEQSLKKTAFEHAGKKVAQVQWEFAPDDVPDEFVIGGYPGFRLWVRWIG